jgi:hypothetical protein
MNDSRTLQEIARETMLHQDAHRLYRAVRARVAMNLSPLDQGFAVAVRDEFRRRYENVFGRTNELAA